MLAVAARAQAPTGPAEAAPEESNDSGYLGLWRGVRPTLGPIFWRANVTSEYRVDIPPGAASRREFIETGNLAASSYVFQPWFAQLNANLGFVRGRSDGSGGSRSTSFTGGTGLSLFPASRFPFSASVDVSDSRSQGELIGAEYRTTLVSMRQSYRTLDDLRFSVSLDRSELKGSAVGSDVLNVISAAFSGRRAAHEFSADARLSGNSGGPGGTQSRYDLLTGRHSFVPASNLNVETIATYNRLEQEQGSGLQRSTLAGRFVQIASYATWRPEEEEPLYDENHPMLVTGALRLTAIETEQANLVAGNFSLSGSAGLSYVISPLTRLSANGSLTQSQSRASGGRFVGALNGILSHAPPPIAFGAYSYTWNSSGGGSATAGGTERRQNAFAQANHQVSRNLLASGIAQVTLSAGQGASVNIASSGGSGLGITHNALATLTLLGETTARTYFSLTASDARTFGDLRSEFQLVNLQATRQAPLSALSFWSANLTVQGARQRSRDAAGGVPGAQDSGFNVSTFGSVAYQHRRAFGVPRLQLLASYTVNQTQLQSRALGDLAAPRENVSDSLDARLDYRIGKVETRLLLRSATVDGRRNTGVFLRVTRNF